MNDPVRYGQLKSEKLAEENQVCRQIAREISLFGITERQRMLVIYLLAMELEDGDKMREITACIKEVAGGDVFLSTQVEEGVPNGSSNV